MVVVLVCVCVWKEGNRKEWTLFCLGVMGSHSVLLGACVSVCSGQSDSSSVCPSCITALDPVTARGVRGLSTGNDQPRWGVFSTTYYYYYYYYYFAFSCLLFYARPFPVTAGSLGLFLCTCDCYFVFILCF